MKISRYLFEITWWPRLDEWLGLNLRTLYYVIQWLGINGAFYLRILRPRLNIVLSLFLCLVSFLPLLVSFFTLKEEEEIHLVRDLDKIRRKAWSQS
jgi:hypothetical protein